MSLDCYPFGERQTIGLLEQPVAIDVAYDDDLFICTIDNCKSVAIFDLNGGGNLIKQFEIGNDVVVDQVVYCKTGDYIACVGHSNGSVSLYTVFRWRTIGMEPIIQRLDITCENNSSISETNKRKVQTEQEVKLNSIDSCQKTGNLAVSLCDVVQIYRCHDTSSLDENFQLIISLKLSMMAVKVCLVENYLSITAIDHVQVLKLESLSLQIQSDSSDADQSSNSLLSNGGVASSKKLSSDANGTNGSGCTSGSEASNTLTGTGEQSSTNNSSQPTSHNHNGSVLTVNHMLEGGNFNSDDLRLLNGTCLPEDAINSVQSSSNDDCITWNLNTKKLVKLPTLMHNTSNELSSYHICHPLELIGPASESIACRVEAKLYSQDYCRNQLEPVVMLCKLFDIDKEPIKSAQLQAIYLSSFEDRKRLSSASNATSGGKSTPACNQLATSGQQQQQQQLLKSSDYELISSVTCFVATLTNCFVYSLSGKKVVRIQTITHPDLCLDFRPDLLNVYLLTPMGLQICSTGTCDSEFRYDWSSSSDLNLNFVACNQTWRCLTSRSHIILVSSSAATTTTTTTTTDADGGCGAAKLAASRSAGFHLIDANDGVPSTSSTIGSLELGDLDEQSQCCLVEFMRKPSLIELGKRIVHTVDRCNSVSIRSNLITYLHASAQLELFKINQDAWKVCGPADDDTGDGTGNFGSNNERLLNTISLLKWVTIFLCKQLIEKKQTNVITNQKLDKQIKHLLDISYCDLAELMKCYLESRQKQQHFDDSIAALGSNIIFSAYKWKLFGSVSSNEDSGELEERLVEEPHDDPQASSGLLEEGEDHERRVDFVNELIKIYLRHAKHSQPMVDYLISITCSRPPAASHEFASTKLIAYLYEFNPRILIKCAQKYTNQVRLDDGGLGQTIVPNDNGSINAPLAARSANSKAENANDQRQHESSATSKRYCLELLSDKLKQLAELDSTGINRATVLFTLAIIHNQLGHREQCLAWLAQIKPLKHLAITMCSNYEISHPIVSLVAQKYPKVFDLFLIQLTKRDPVVARQFATQVERADTDDVGSLNSDSKRLASNDTTDQHHHHADACPVNEHNDDDEDDDNFEQRLRLVADIAPVELADLFIGAKRASGSSEDSEAIGAYLKASINLLEAQFILTRLCENSH